MRIIVLGATGMLGQGVTKESVAAGFDVIEVSRTSGLRWNYFDSNFASLASAIPITKEDVVVNCVGWIPQKSSGAVEVDEHDSNALNVQLIQEIQASQDALGFGWVQIVTDCVFSGETGHYSEFASFDPIDLYGKTKALGEKLMPGAMRIRSSIIGPDPIHQSGLFEWFKNQSPQAKVRGYINQLWNGVSTKAFGRLVAGLSLAELVEPGIQHWIPEDSLSKYALLSTFKAVLERADVSIERSDSGRSSNRVLATTNPDANLRLWTIAGYNRIPSVEDLVREFILEDLEEGM